MADVFVNGFTSDVELFLDFKDVSKFLSFFDFYIFKSEHKSVSRYEVFKDLSGLVIIPNDEYNLYSFSRKKNKVIRLMYVFNEHDLVNNGLSIDDLYYEPCLVFDELFSRHDDYPARYFIAKHEGLNEWVVFAYVLNSNKSGIALSSGFNKLFRVIYEEVDNSFKELGLSRKNKVNSTEFGDTIRSMTRIHKDIILDVLQKARKVSTFKSDDDLLEFLFRQGVPSVIDGDDLICSAKNYYGKYETEKSKRFHHYYKLSSFRENYVE